MLAPSLEQRNELLNAEVLPVVNSQHWSVNDEGGVFKDLEDINRSLDNVWNTEVGSDILRPNFGCNWVQYIDYPIDEAPLLIIRELMIASIKWEPRVLILSIVPTINISQIFFYTRYMLNPAIAGDLKGLEHFITVKGLL